MRFNLSRETLLKPLQQVSSVVERRQTMPVLSNVLVVVKNGVLTLTATDNEVEMIATLPVVGAEDGETTLPAKKWVDICRALPEESQIDISVDYGKDKALIKSGKSRFNLVTLPVNEFPSIQEMNKWQEVLLSQREFKRLIEKSQFAMAQQDVRYYLNGLLLDVNKTRVRTVATDGHRLALCEVKGDFASTDALQVVIPRKGITELGRLLEDSEQPVTLQVSTNHIRIKLPSITFTSKLIDGKFPDYERVIPRNGDKIVIAQTQEIKQALIRTAILSNEKYRGIRVKLTPNVFEMQSHNPEMESAEEQISVDYKGEELEIGFNVTYMVDALNAVSSPAVRLTLGDTNSSCLIEPDIADGSARYVIMPMRL